jgi:hypothetical protein
MVEIVISELYFISLVLDRIIRRSMITRHRCLREVEQDRKAKVAIHWKFRKIVYNGTVGNNTPAGIRGLNQDE